MKRKVIKIDEEKCNGCGICIPNCHEGALQIIDGKARLINDLFCDGLGACIGHCPEGAIEIEDRETVPYNEKEVMKSIVKQGEGTVLAHLNHLKEHGEYEYFEEGIAYIKEHHKDINLSKFDNSIPDFKLSGGGCLGARTIDFRDKSRDVSSNESSKQLSQLRQWPVQLHLVNPLASYFKGADLLLAADCTAFAMGNFHQDYLKNKSLAIACPKLDNDQAIYIDKITELINKAQINTITIMIMEVPCCGGLVRIVNMAQQRTNRKIPVKCIVISVSGDVISEEWI